MESRAAIRINQNGGVYHCGKLYDDSKKLHLAISYMKLIKEDPVSCRRLGEVTVVGMTFANMVINKICIDIQNLAVDCCIIGVAFMAGAIGATTLLQQDSLRLLTFSVLIMGRFIVTGARRLLDSLVVVILLSSIIQDFEKRRIKKSVVLWNDSSWSA